MKIGEICVKKWRKADPGLLLWLHRFSSAVPYTLLSTWASLRNPIIRIEVVVADLMTFTLSALEEDLDPLKGRPISSNSMIGVFLWLVKMEKVAKTYKARFVVNISEQGEDDPLAQNVSCCSLYLSFFFLLFVLT
uniref:Uncharacterized protein LOC105121156 isoform X1 n=1 Tax=Rhizophora mucronata TaxID=61149 RepID=A0A2P2KIE6_RHIMU